MSAKTQRIGSIALLVLMGLAVLFLFGFGLASADTQQALGQEHGGMDAITAAGDGGTSGSTTVPVAILTGLIVLATASVRLAEGAIGKLRKNKNGESGLSPQLEHELRTLCDVHKAIGPDGRLAVYSSTACGPQHSKMVDLLDCMLKKQQLADSEALRALENLQTSLGSLNQSVVGLTNRMDTFMAMSAFHQGRRDDE